MDVAVDKILCEFHNVFSEYYSVIVKSAVCLLERKKNFIIDKHLNKYVLKTDANNLQSLNFDKIVCFNMLYEWKIEIENAKRFKPNYFVVRFLLKRVELIRPNQYLNENIC